MQQPIFVQPCSHMLFFTYLTKHMMMSFFCVYDVLYREEESFSSSVKNTDVNLYHHYSTLEV